MSEWIDANIELPHCTACFIVCGYNKTPKKVTGVSRWVTDRWPFKPGWVSIAGDIRIVTYWMPLPEPPK